MAISIEEISIERLGVLQNVFCEIEPDISNAITKIFLEFEGKILVVGVNDEDDSISLTLTKHQDALEYSIVKGTQFEMLMNSIRFRRIQWVWELINQQGYFDGIQFEFVKEDCISDAVTVQFLAIASTIEVRVVEAVACQFGGCTTGDF
jgi:hypothetical protein